MTLDNGHRLDPDRFLSALKAKRPAATGPDAFRVPELFRGLAPDTEEVCGVTGRFLASLARPGALHGARTPRRVQAEVHREALRPASPVPSPS